MDNARFHLETTIKKLPGSFQYGGFIVNPSTGEIKTFGSYDLRNVLDGISLIINRRLDVSNM